MKSSPTGATGAAAVADRFNASSFASRRILQVVTPSHVGGAEILLARLAPRLRDLGCTVEIVSNTASRCLEELRETMADADFSVEALPLGGKFNPRALFALMSAARRTKADFTHTHLSSASWWGGWLDRLDVCPSIGHVHGFTSARWHRRQSHLIACSEAVKHYLVYQGIDENRITVLPNPVGPDDIEPHRSPEAVRRELGADMDTPVIGCFAHFKSEKKGWRELMASIPLVLAGQPNAQFWCVGAGSLRGQYEAMVEASGCLQNVRFLGFRRDVADLMNAIDVMALPSHREPFGLVYVEAALLGKPSIACSAGGAPEVVDHKQTGLLVPPLDSEQLAEAILQLLDNPDQAHEMGRLGRERALERFSWETYLRGLNEVYQRIGPRA